MSSEITLEDAFRAMIKTFKPEKAKDYDRVIQFDIELGERTGKPGGKYYMEIKDQKCSFHEGEHSNPDIVFYSDADNYLDMLLGKVDVITLATEKKIRVKGPMPDVMAIEEIFPAKPGGGYI
ncbi:MAG: SCP2 sterol-binding domain-containing protein [Candidatus Lokiarchaeia archaeon]